MKFECRCTEKTNALGEVRIRRDGLLHCKDGPALINPNGYQVWYFNGREHRENGAARIYPDGKVEYWLDGRHYSHQGYINELERRKLARGK